MLRKTNLSKNANWISKVHNGCFIKWLNNHIVEELNINAYSVCERLKWLVNGSNIHFLSYISYLINEFTFYTRNKMSKIEIQFMRICTMLENVLAFKAVLQQRVQKIMLLNSRRGKIITFVGGGAVVYMTYNSVRISGVKTYHILLHLHRQHPEALFYPPKCTLLIYISDIVMSYFWVIKQICELDYTMFWLLVFVVCELITTMTFELMNEPFILASQAQQVFYVSDSANMKWYIVLLTNKIIVNNIDDQEYKDIDVKDDLFWDITIACC
ncbi:hypothetical protein Lal_00040353 [Lupinus albus]|nr:hypothetical protein Lal_00040353 [Lupinus albus]